MRLFVAVNIPEAVKTSLEKAQKELREALPNSRIGWTKAQQFHLTLKFLGEVEAGALRALSQAVRGACAPFASMALRAEQVGFFPNLRRPRVIWAAVRDADGELRRLQEAVEMATRAWALPEAGKEFSGHATLGRIKALAKGEEATLERLWRKMETIFFGEWVADRVVIFKSELRPEGAAHVALENIILPPRTAARES